MKIFRISHLLSSSRLRFSPEIMIARTKQSRTIFLVMLGVISLGLSGCYFEPPGYYGNHEYREHHHHHHDHDY